MFVETSAIVAILRDEPDKLELLARIHSAPRRVTSCINAIEAGIVLARTMGDADAARLVVKRLLAAMDVVVDGVPSDIFDDVMVAYGRYGKGTGHPARLNFGDCISYAMAKRADLPLLYKGGDFARTDLA